MNEKSTQKLKFTTGNCSTEIYTEIEIWKFPRYLPRKFKTVVAIPPYNDVDIYAHDLGYIAIVENDQIVG